MTGSARTPGRGRGFLALVASAVLVLTGCGASSGGEGDDRFVFGANGGGGGTAIFTPMESSGADETASTGSEATAGESDQASSGAATGGRGTVATAAPPSATATTTVRGVDRPQFSSPSKNIGCVMTDAQVRCDISQRSWTPPAKPADCDLDYGNSLFVAGGTGQLGCISDSVLGGTTVVDYGSAVRSSAFECVSAQTGMYCRSLRTGHGFNVSKESYVVF